jgi:hypothetical protein
MAGILFNKRFGFAGLCDDSIKALLQFLEQLFRPDKAAKNCQVLRG